MLDDCLENHARCPNRMQRLLPTRVLDLRPTGQNESVKLYVSGNDEQGEYAALSYCWGGAQTFTTTKMTLNDRIHGIFLSGVAQTIQDAILATRALGIRYLWVDALCIVQDDFKDKVREIAAMGAIFRNALVTIAATSSSNVHEGFLSARSPAQACLLPFTLPDGAFGTVSLVASDFQLLRDEPLNRRGWTFHKRMYCHHVC